MAITGDAFFVAHCLGNRLTQSDAHIFNGVVIINVCIAFGCHSQINHAVPGNLIQHVIEEWNPRIELSFARTI